MKDNEISEKLAHLSLADLVANCNQAIGEHVQSGFCGPNVNSGSKSFCTANCKNRQC